MELLLRALNQLPEGEDCIWQGAWMRLPEWVAEEGEEPARPWVFFWTNPANGLLHTDHGVLRSHERTVEIPMRELVSFARKKQFSVCRPRIIQVNDQDLARALADGLQSAGIDVQYLPQIPYAEEVRANVYAQKDARDIGPGILEGAGVTLDQVRSFAEAAALFYEAAPWEVLESDDPIIIETTQSPAPLKALSVTAVMGAQSKNYGLSFHASFAAFKKMAFELRDNPDPSLKNLPKQAWSVFFEPMHGIPILDADLWEDTDLPVAGEDAYPMPICFKKPDTLTRPAAKELTHMEACLRVLAAVTEDESDSGRFEREVHTHHGPVTLTMSLPLLLEPPTFQQMIAWGFPPDRRSSERMFDAIQHKFGDRDFHSAEEFQAAINAEFLGKKIDDFAVDTSTPRGLAREYCFQAYDSIGRRRRALARQAVEINPDCADAYVILAEETPNPQRARDYYEQGVAAGERAIGGRRFEEDAGEFWVRHDTRPYMRARAGLARSLILTGDEAGGIDHYQALLDLDRRDSMGVRHILFFVLQENGRYEDAFELIQRFPEDPWIPFKYGRALLLFRRDGDTPEARQAMRAALKENPLVADFLLHPGKEPLATGPVGGRRGSRSLEDETQGYEDALPLVHFVERHGDVRRWLRTEVKRFRRSGRRSR